MNRDTFEGQWTQLKGKIRQKWGRLTDDEVEEIKGSRDMFVGKLQEKYGQTREELERDLDRWLEEESAPGTRH